MILTSHIGRARRNGGATLALLALFVLGAGTGHAVAQQDAAPTAVERPADPPTEAVTSPSSPRPGAALPAAAGSEAKPETRHTKLSPLGMFLGADPVVQGVMLLLVFASLATWTVLLVRALALFFAKRRMRWAIAAIQAADSLSSAAEAVRNGTANTLIAVAEGELTRSPGLPGDGIKERAQVALGRIEAAAAKRAAAGTGILATIGSTGPFVGLFGTVWGIMHSFIGIAESHTTNLAVVAPGIAEALLATGIGLVAAIPAVVIYNGLTRAVTSYRALIGDAVALILCHLSRDLDRRAFTIGLAQRQVGLHIAAE